MENLNPQGKVSRYEGEVVRRKAEILSAKGKYHLWIRRVNILPQ